jgi:hypothetical protein
MGEGKGEGTLHNLIAISIPKIFSAALSTFLAWSSDFGFDLVFLQSSINFKGLREKKSEASTHFHQKD